MCSFVVFLIHRDYLATKITNYKHSLNILVNENEIRQGFEIERVKPLISDPANAHSTNDTVYVALSDPDSMKFHKLLGPFHMHWRTTMHAK